MDTSEGEVQLEPSVEDKQETQVLPKVGDIVVVLNPESMVSESFPRRRVGDVTAVDADGSGFTFFEAENEYFVHVDIKNYTEHGASWKLGGMLDLPKARRQRVKKVEKKQRQVRRSKFIVSDE